MYLCSVLSKSVAVLLPAAFFLIDIFIWLKLNHGDQRLVCTITPAMAAKYVAQKALVLTIMLSFIGVTIWSNEEGSTDSDTIELSLSERILKATMAPAWIVTQMAWPTQLRAHYQLREDELDLLGNPECLLSVLSLVLSVFWGISQWLEDRSPQLLLASAYFCAMVLPTCGLIAHGMVSMNCDRYAYFPSAVFVPFGGYWLAAFLFEGDDDRRTQRKTAVSAERDDPPERTVSSSVSKNSVNQASVSRARADSDASGFSSSVIQLLKGHIPLSALLWVIFVTVLSLSLILSTQRLENWRTERNLYSSSLRVDASDWRVYSTQFETLLYTPKCRSAEDPQCRLLWELSFAFAPTRTLKAKLHRLKIMFALGDREEACRMYAELLNAFPTSAHTMNNVGICKFRVGYLDDALSLFYRAAYAPGYRPLVDNDGKNVPLNNYRALDRWLDAFRAEHGERLPNAAERGQFAVVLMW